MFSTRRTWLVTGFAVALGLIEAGCKPPPPTYKAVKVIVKSFGQERSSSRSTGAKPDTKPELTFYWDGNGTLTARTDFNEPNVEVINFDAKGLATDTIPASLSIYSKISIFSGGKEQVHENTRIVSLEKGKPITFVERPESSK